MAKTAAMAKGPSPILCVTCWDRAATWVELDKSGKHVYRCSAGHIHIYHRSRANILSEQYWIAWENDQIVPTGQAQP